MTPEKASVAWNIAAGLGVLLLLSSVIPSKTGPSPSPRMRAVNHMKSLALACRAYAADWEGKLPPTLDALYPDFIDVESYSFAIDPNGKKSPSFIEVAKTL